MGLEVNVSCGLEGRGIWAETMKKEVRTLGNYLKGKFQGMRKLGTGKDEHRDPWVWGQTGHSIGRTEDKFFKTAPIFSRNAKPT